MQAMELIRRCLGEDILSSVGAGLADVSEIRLRTGRPASFHTTDGCRTEGTVITERQMGKIVSALSMDSLYAVEDQLSECYFTTKYGMRVGVCGRLSCTADGKYRLTSIGSLCIRIPREVTGCAEGLWKAAGLASILILSPPGMGKTTLIRDYVRIVSDEGYNVAVADERREIAACWQGIPQLNLGKSCDVIDDCPKVRAIPLLLRSCAPDMIAADEIALKEEAQALREAAKCGVKIAATAHAGSVEDALERRATGMLLREGVFQYAVLLGGKPGNILGIYQF